MSKKDELGRHICGRCERVGTRYPRRIGDERVCYVCWKRHAANGRGYDPLWVACPSCQAEPGDPCKRANGAVMLYCHKSRLALSMREAK